MSDRRFSSWGFGVLCCVVLVGCGREAQSTKGSTPKAPVSGTITLGGKPLEGAEVYFYTAGFTGFAKTDAAGKYRLVQGAAIGANKVFISKLEGGSQNAAPTDDPVMALNDPGQLEAAQDANASRSSAKQLIPPEFSSQATTKLEFDVPEKGAKDVDFNL
ncbi:MAG: hypothetical protein JSS49_19090 [Planctomycetes bacterium]|nr:hypothetical protein [Planctomycetota bacterium]